MMDAADCRVRFRELHRSGCFLMPNPWDAGSARALESMGFAALASSSAAFAWSIGRRDKDVPLALALEHFRTLVAAVDVPVNADFENGFADDPKDVAANVEAAVATGIAGLSVEDSTSNAASPLYDFDLAVARVAAARDAIDRTGSNVMLTARSEGFLVGRPDRDETIRRLQAYRTAGADCLFAPGLRTHDDIRAVVEAVAPAPVNVLMSADFATVPDLAALGVRRISVGGALARTAWSAMLQAAREIVEQGTFTSLTRGTPAMELNRLFEDER